MNEIIEAAKAEFLRSKNRLVKLLESTPDDKLNWAPAEGARTPVQQVVHAASAIPMMQAMFEGKPFPFASFKELDESSRETEKGYTTREAALELLETNSNGYIAWLDGLTDEQVNSMFNMMGNDVPMASAITFVADHNRCHAGQIDYIQTCYGDYEWHMA